jgi:SAM-dependent methyltransferase
MSQPHSQTDLERIYRLRFGKNQVYRQRVWAILTERFFQKYVRPDDAVLDLGCGYGEFINQIRCGAKFGMDLNPESPRHLDAQVKFLSQDCSERWPLPDATLNVVFTSNFFEHLPSKAALARTLDQAHRCLKPGGRLIALGPNVKFLPGAYWDFWDHYLPLTELSLSEGLRAHGFDVAACWSRFLPYTMVNAPPYPVAFLRAYLAVPLFWKIFGRQFLLVAVRQQG